MKKWIVIILCFLSIYSCKVIKYVPVEHTVYVHTKDSIYFRDTTIKYKIETQYIKDYTGLLDTLNLETDYAKARAYIDTTNNLLTGEIRNKDKILNIDTQLKEKIVYRDSVVTQEVPIEVIKEVKTHFPYEKWLWIWSVASLLLLGAIAYIKFRKI